MPPGPVQPEAVSSRTVAEGRQVARSILWIQKRAKGGAIPFLTFGGPPGVHSLRLQPLRAKDMNPIHGAQPRHMQAPCASAFRDLTLVGVTMMSTGTSCSSILEESMGSSST